MANAILSHGDDALTLAAEAATRVVWNFPWHQRKRSPECVCQQTSPKQKETRISCWRPKQQVMSRTSQPNLRLASALARKQDLPTNYQWSAPGPGDTHFSIVAKFQQSSETSYWAQALNMKMASWSEPEGIHSTLQNSLPYHPLPHTPQYSHSASRINPATRHTHSTTRTTHVTLKGPELRHLPVLTTSSCCLEGHNNRKGRQVICPLTVHQTGTVVRVPHHLTLSSTHPERPWLCWLVNSPGVHMIKKSSFIKSDIWINEIELRVQK